jgi:hypothetical protein
MSILLDRLKEKIIHNQDKVRNAVITLERTTQDMKDFLVTKTNDDFQFKADHSMGKLMLLFLSSIPNDNVKVNQTTIHKNAVTQLASRLNLQTAFMNSLAEGEIWKQELAQDIFNQFLIHNAREKFLVRTVGTETRGILTDKYKRSDSMLLAKSFIEAVESNKAVLYDAHVSDTKQFFEAVLPQEWEIPTEYNGIRHITFGMRYSNSDFGDGAMQVKTFLLELMCQNGMSREVALRNVHLGKRLQEDTSFISDRSIRLESELQASLIDDSTRMIFSEDNIQTHIQKIILASQKKVTDNEIKNLQTLGVNQSEIADIKTELTESREDHGVTGELTLLKLVNAIGWVANQKEDVRSRELQDVAGKLMK